MTTHHGDDDDDEDSFEYARVLQGLQLRVQNAGYGLTGLLLELLRRGGPMNLSIKAANASPHKETKVGLVASAASKSPIASATTAAAILFMSNPGHW